MKRTLVDVNVLLALMLRRHEHHASAGQWFAAAESVEIGVCRSVHLALIRLLCARAVTGPATLTAPSALTIVEELLADERLELVPEPAGIDRLLPSLLVHPVPAAKLVMDAYLAAFAIASSRRLVTFDKGFRQFAGLDLHLLS